MNRSRFFYDVVRKSRKAILAALYVPLILMSFIANAQWNTDPLINTAVCTTPTTQQMFPQTCPDGTGGVFITWAEQSADMTTSTIFVQRLDANGTRQWPVGGLPISSLPAFQIYPRIISNDEGGAIIGWIFQSGLILKHYVQKISASGQLLWGANGVEVCPVASIPGYFFQLIPDELGGAILLWEDSRETQTRLYSQRIDKNGAIVWLTDGLATSPLAIHTSSYVAVANSSGGMFVSWTRVVNLLLYNDIFVQRVSPEGILQWGANGMNVSNKERDQILSKIVKDKNDNLIVVWQDFIEDPVRSKIFGQRISSDGTKLWNNSGVLLVDSIVPQSTVLKIASDTSGGAIITWLDDYTTVPNSTVAHLHAMRFDSTGAPVWPSKQVATWGDGQMPVDYQLVPDYQQGCYIAWHKAFDAPDDPYNLYAQHVLPNGQIEWSDTGKAITKAPSFQIYEHLTCDSNGVAVLVWTDTRSGTNYDLYAGLVSVTIAAPVNWLEFSAIHKENAILLSWKTSAEINNTGFYIERSRDGLFYQPIGFVESVRVPAISYSYSFIDTSPFEGTNYYRLKQIDIDGKFEYSRIILLSKHSDKKFILYPNPAKEKLHLVLTEKSLITIYATDGRLVKQMTKMPGGGSDIDITSLKKGIYFISIRNETDGTINASTFIKD